jgi:hypothetical protein
VVLSNTTLGMLTATIDISNVHIALPDIFRGIHLDPLKPLHLLSPHVLASAPAHTQHALAQRRSFPSIIT